VRSFRYMPESTHETPTPIPALVPRTLIFLGAEPAPTYLVQFVSFDRVLKLEIPSNKLVVGLDGTTALLLHFGQRAFWLSSPRRVTLVKV
jgi:hypothetical protein